MLRSRLSRSHFWQLFFFIFFLRRAKSHFSGFKVFHCYSLFYTSSFWFPEALPTCTMKGRWFFPLFLLGRLALERDVASSLFLVFLFFVLSFRSVLIFLLTVLTRLGGSEPFGGLWESWLSFLLQYSDMGFFSFSFFFSHKLLGFPFSFLMLLLGFKPLGPAISSLSWPPCTYFFGLGYCGFFLRPQQVSKLFKKL